MIDDFYTIKGPSKTVKIEKQNSLSKLYLMEVNRRFVRSAFKWLILPVVITIFLPKGISFVYGAEEWVENRNLVLIVGLGFFSIIVCARILDKYLIQRDFAESLNDFDKVGGIVVTLSAKEQQFYEAMMATALGGEDKVVDIKENDPEFYKRLLHSYHMVKRLASNGIVRMAKRQVKITLKNAITNEQWNEMMYDFFFDDFQKEYPHLDPKNSQDDENELITKFLGKFILSNFTENHNLYEREMADLELIIDEDLNVVEGKIIKPKSK